MDSTPSFFNVERNPNGSIAFRAKDYGAITKTGTSGLTPARTPTASTSANGMVGGLSNVLRSSNTGVGANRSIVMNQTVAVKEKTQ